MGGKELWYRLTHYTAVKSIAAEVQRKQVRTKCSFKGFLLFLTSPLFTGNGGNTKLSRRGRATIWDKRPVHCQIRSEEEAEMLWCFLSHVQQRKYGWDTFFEKENWRRVYALITACQASSLSLWLPNEFAESQQCNAALWKEKSASRSRKCHGVSLFSRHAWMRHSATALHWAEHPFSFLPIIYPCQPAQLWKSTLFLSPHYHHHLHQPLSVHRRGFWGRAGLCSVLGWVSVGKTHRWCFHPLVKGDYCFWSAARPRPGGGKHWLLCERHLTGYDKQETLVRKEGGR